MEARESIVVSGLSEVGGGDGAKDSPSSTPSPSPTSSPPAGSGAVGIGALGQPLPPPPGMGMARDMNMSMGVGMGSGCNEDLAPKKRGRPRKYGLDGSSMTLALSSTSSSSPFSPVGIDFSS